MTCGTPWERTIGLRRITQSQYFQGPSTDCGSMWDDTVSSEVGKGFDMRWVAK